MNYLRGFVVLFALAITGPALADFEFYTGASIGRSKADAQPGDLSNPLSAMGYDVQSVKVDSDDGGTRFLIGLRFTDTWAVEMGYVDLGEVKTRVMGDIAVDETAQFAQDVANLLPVMPRGLTLAAVARFSLTQLGMSGPLAENINIALKLGMIDSDSDRDAGSVSGAGEVDASPYYGLNLGYDFNDTWRGVIGFEVFNIGNTTDYWSAGLEYRFHPAR